MDLKRLSRPPYNVPLGDLLPGGRRPFARYRADLRRGTKEQVLVLRESDRLYTHANIKSLMQQAATDPALRAALKVHDRPAGSSP